ncbi:metallophosphoesterase [Thermosipho ferrireducens]|uniref:Metallophosphoesterase n=1 Tax=Thermosipho ferrireducens TaxID=2571116 RepID=A0ABX7SAH3_9BACT|nr:metallophosphoesterase [Thermosipho ferrireducens]QTA38418.1 metallophosphoesterase [Thermosipho ferrireducens]
MKIKILLTSDIHGSELAVKKLRAIKNCFDYFIFCGDLLPKFVDEDKSLKEVQQEWFYNIFLPLAEEINGYFILGNDDKIHYEGKRLLNDPLEIENGISIISYDKVPLTPFNTWRELSDDLIEEQLQKLTVKKPFIFITHAPPFKILDEARRRNFGSKAIRDFVFKENPLVHCFGHIHESFGDIKINDVTFINCAFETFLKFYIIEIDENLNVETYEL